MSGAAEAAPTEIERTAWATAGADIDYGTEYAEIDVQERIEAGAEHDWLTVRVYDRAAAGRAVVLRCARCDAWLRMLVRADGEVKILNTDPDPMPAACSCARPQK